MPDKTKRDALEALICERIEREIERLDPLGDGNPSARAAGKCDGLQAAVRIIKQAFEECR